MHGEVAAAFDHVEVITFDCYGTLIDWEAGILGALRPLLQRHGHANQASDAQILERYARLESAAQGGAFRPYREVLRRVVDAFASELGFTASQNERRSLENSLAHWQPFPDTVGALQTLAKRYRLALLSNVDDDLFETTSATLQVNFAHVITAQRVGAYKPAPEFFRSALQIIAVPTAAVLHVAQSLHHDIGPARRLGLATVWVNRRHGRQGFGATTPSSAVPDMEVANLKALVSSLEL